MIHQEERTLAITHLCTGKSRGAGSYWDPTVMPCQTGGDWRFYLTFAPQKSFFLQAEWRFFSLSFHLPLLLSHCHHISRKTQNEPYFYSRSLQPSRLKGWELTSLFPSLPPESTFTYKVPLTTSMCSLHLLPLLSSVFCHRPSSSLASSLG